MSRRYTLPGRSVWVRRAQTLLACFRVRLRSRCARRNRKHPYHSHGSLESMHRRDCALHSARTGESYDCPALTTFPCVSAINCPFTSLIRITPRPAGYQTCSPRIAIGGGSASLRLCGRNVLVDLGRFELTTSSMPFKRAPNRATLIKGSYSTGAVTPAPPCKTSRTWPFPPSPSNPSAHRIPTQYSPATGTSP